VLLMRSVSLQKRDMVKVSAFDYVFPVIGGDRSNTRPGWTMLRNVFGTAFSLGGNTFLTAGHVIKAATAHESFDICLIEDGAWGARKIIRHEVLEDLDAGFFEANVPGAKALRWSDTELSMLDSVAAVGFPYALEITQAKLNVRAFRGEIVSTRTWDGLSAKPQIYELSFQCPRGLSGAPLWISGNPPAVVGFIIGNSIIEMIIHSEKEESLDGGKTTIYEKTESLRLGIAIQAQAILDRHSEILGTTLREHLHRTNLIIA
jgi:hypothetical protein